MFSPNHLELLSLFEESNLSAISFDRKVIEKYASRVLDAASDETGRCTLVVVRAGEHGCLTVSKGSICRWLPPFHDPDSRKIIDTTGAGNTFLGAFGLILEKTKDCTEAAIFGSVAASFAVEQIGLPTKGFSNNADTWNEEAFESRLQQYRSRIAC